MGEIGPATGEVAAAQPFDPTADLQRAHQVFPFIVDEALNSGARTTSSPNLVNGIGIMEITASAAFLIVSARGQGAETRTKGASCEAETRCVGCPA